MAVTVTPIGPSELLITDADGRQHRVFVAATKDRRWAFCNGEVWEIAVATPAARRKRAAGHETLAAPMPATVIGIPVAIGERVTRGQTVLVLEAMKMEMPLRAAHDGAVIAINCAQGELVQPGVILIEIE
jgi:biotin carboxyl carrier protein